MFRNMNFVKLFIVVVALLNFGMALHADETGVPSPLAPEAVSAAMIKYFQQPGSQKNAQNTVTDCGKFFVVEVISHSKVIPHVPEKPGISFPGKTLANYRVIVQGIGNTSASEAATEDMLTALRLNHRKYLILMANMNPDAHIGQLAKQYEEKYRSQLSRITLSLEKAIDADDAAGSDVFYSALSFIEKSVKSHLYTTVYGELIDSLIQKVESSLENAKMEHKGPVVIIKIKENLDAVKGCKAIIADLSKDSEWKAFWNSSFIETLGPIPGLEQPRCSMARNDLYTFVSENSSEYNDVLVYQTDYEQLGQGKIQVTMLARQAFINKIKDGRKLVSKAVYVMLKNKLYKDFTIKSRIFYSGTGEVLLSNTFGKTNPSGCFEPEKDKALSPKSTETAKASGKNPSGCFTPEDVQVRVMANTDFAEFLKRNRDQYAPVPVEKVLCNKVGKYDYQVTLLMGRILNIRDDGKKHIAKANYLVKNTYKLPGGTWSLKIQEREFYGLDGKLLK